MRTTIPIYILSILFITSICAAEELTKEQYKQAYEEKTVQVKELQWELYRSDQFITIGRKWYQNLVEETRELRKENTGLKKQLQSARDYLEMKGVFLSDITNKVYNITEGPLYLEKLARQRAEEQFRQEKAERDVSTRVLERKISELNRELYLVGQERDTYQKQVNEDRQYFQALQKNGIIK